MALIGNKGDTPDEQVDTIKEFHEAEQKLLWKQDPMQALKYEAVESRKKWNFLSRFTITLLIVLTFLFLVWLLFYVELPPDSRDLINIMVGAYVAVLAKSTDYWFKDKDDPEHKETADMNGNGNGNGEAPQE